MLNKYKDKFVLYNHYTHLGTWSSGGAWGAKQSTSSTLAESYKYKALKDWVASNPAREGEDLPFVEPQLSNGTLTVAPNPASNKVSVTPSEAGIVSILNLNGTVLDSKSSDGTTVEFDLSGYSSGVYLVKAGNKVSKLIKE